MKSYIKRFKEIGPGEVGIVGCKNASLGEMINGLSSKGIAVPDGFATTADAFRLFLSHNELQQQLKTLLNQLDKKHFSNLRQIGSQARKLMLEAEMPEALQHAIVTAYNELCSGNDIEVAVRSSATAEDLP
jgi:pyruvate, water dikinase